MLCNVPERAAAVCSSWVQKLGARDRRVADCEALSGEACESSWRGEPRGQVESRDRCSNPWTDDAVVKMLLRDGVVLCCFQVRAELGCRESTTAYLRKGVPVDGGRDYRERVEYTQ